MALAGAERIFELMDEEPEVDNGYVTLVNAKYDKNGELAETPEKTNIWAWKHPARGRHRHLYAGSRGDVRFFDVDFGYEPDKIGAARHHTVCRSPVRRSRSSVQPARAKTTITNLINRFYDIADGKIRYDGININKIKKADLRRSLGIVLQDTNLFTGTVMENIRYGTSGRHRRGSASAAAKLANADDFIRRLPDGYDTVISRRRRRTVSGPAPAAFHCACSGCRSAGYDPGRGDLLASIPAPKPSCSAGMDGLMHGRTVFVIAHRLSTVQNADVIMVLEHRPHHRARQP